MDSRYLVDAFDIFLSKKIRRKIMITYKNDPKYKILITSKNQYFYRLEMSKSEWTTKAQNPIF